MAHLDQRGVTMVELMVAMLLLATALLGLAASFPYAMYGVIAGGFQTTASLLAQQAIEKAKATDYATLNTMDIDGYTGTLPTSCGDADFRTVTEPISYAGFSRCVAVQPGVPTGTTTTVTVIVRFSGPIPNPIWQTTVSTILAS
jgi:prepilin-type N-terminal cleavage/methylation domain-containing protein